MSDVKVASMTEWPDKVEASISALKTDLWKMAATTHVRDRGTSGQFLWWSGASSYTLMTADLSGVVQWRLGARCAVMDSRRWR